jgi:hypothetical protein
MDPVHPCTDTFLPDGLAPRGRTPKAAAPWKTHSSRVTACDLRHPQVSSIHSYHRTCSIHGPTDLHGIPRTTWTWRPRTWHPQAFALSRSDGFLEDVSSHQRPVSERGSSATRPVTSSCPSSKAPMFPHANGSGLLAPLPCATDWSQWAVSAGSCHDNASSTRGLQRLCGRL